MTIREIFTTIEDFEAFVNQPENADNVFELIGGEIYQVPSNPYVSKLAARLILLIGIYLMENDLGHLTGEAGGYIVSGERYAPDVAFISYEKQPELAKEGYNPNPPDLAIEIISSDTAQEQSKLRIKLSNYLAAGVVVWIVKPEQHEVEVHQSGEAVKFYLEKDTVIGEPVLPDFTLKVTDIFK